VFEWLTPLRHIWEVPVSNLGPKTSYPYWLFNGFLQSLQAIALVVL
jgi:hypothetical protein